ncbi:MAG: succinylglutamate desuccinylase/aspartoacylase family protein [Bdellovibrionaceae bacterium]|nr:succinylglutamate desuccinylase/aspartoacylase family protein [Bdellovibrionales bacterium]MCB9083420.1 succinylglutamate desuccinylase/aspartoacylase family protein [Pseudobdellovibrionaceae bacterium]
MKSFIFGHSRQNLPLVAYQFGNSGPNVLILGGVHGDEWEGVVAAKALLARLAQGSLPKLQLTLIPMFNVDGVLSCQRKNSAGVDLNRNLPTQDWSDEVASDRYDPGTSANSEPENQALTQWLETHNPRLIISLHSWKPMLNTNGDCTRVAEVIAKHTGYEIHESIGYPTPGCLGTYCGLERDMPTITYEIERGLHPDKIVGIHVPAILESLKIVESAG